MTNRQANGAANLLDKKFEIGAETYLIGNILLHIRKYNGDYSTKEGVSLFSNQCYQHLELLQKKEKGTLNMGQMCICKTKCAIMVERLDKGASIQLNNMAVTNMQSR